MLKHISILLAFLFGLCEAQQQDLNKINVELEELGTKLVEASRATSVNAARRVGNIVRRIKNKCNSDVYESAQVLRDTFFKYLQEINEEIVDEVITVEDILKRLESGSIDEEEIEKIVAGFSKYKKSIVDGLTKSKEFIDLQYVELNKMLKTCLASRPADETVPQTGGTNNILLVPVTLTTAAAFIAIKLEFH